MRPGHQYALHRMSLFALYGLLDLAADLEDDMPVEIQQTIVDLYDLLDNIDPGGRHNDGMWEVAEMRAVVQDAVDTDTLEDSNYGWLAKFTRMDAAQQMARTKQTIGLRRAYAERKKANARAAGQQNASTEGAGQPDRNDLIPTASGIG